MRTRALTIKPISTHSLYIHATGKNYTICPVSIGAVITKNDTEIWNISRFISDQTTIYIALFRALIISLHRALERNITSIDIYTDFLPFIHLMNRNIHIDEYELLQHTLYNLTKRFRYIAFYHLKKESPFYMHAKELSSAAFIQQLSFTNPRSFS
jgi:ribonuclease HI